MTESAESAQLREFRENLQLLHDVLATTSMASRYWVWCGLLLGWAREGKILAHDVDDADFAYLQKDRDHFLNAIPVLKAAGFDLTFRWINNAGVVTEYVFHKDSSDFEFFELMQDKDEFCYWLYDGAYEYACRIPSHGLAPMPFLDRIWQKPDEHERHLTAIYGDWREPDPHWTFLQEESIVECYPWDDTHAWHTDESPMNIQLTPLYPVATLTRPLDIGQLVSFDEPMGEHQTVISGWEFLCPIRFTAIWNGGDSPTDIEIQFYDDIDMSFDFVVSSRGGGILTFQSGYRVTIPQNSYIWLRDSLNHSKLGIYAVEQIMAPEVSPVSLVFAWQFTAPNQMVRFEDGEPFGLMLPQRIDMTTQMKIDISRVALDVEKIPASDQTVTENSIVEEFSVPDDELLEIYQELVNKDDRLSGQHQAVLRILKVFDSLCRKHKIQYWICGSTLLGAVRRRGFLPGQHDASVAMLHESLDRFVTVAATDLPGDLALQPLTPTDTGAPRYRLVEHSSRSHDPSSKHDESAGGILEIYSHRLVSSKLSADLSNLHIRQNKLQQDSHIHTPYALSYGHLFPLRTIEFEELWLPIPRDYEGMLRFQYSDYSHGDCSPLLGQPPVDVLLDGPSPAKPTGKMPVEIDGKPCIWMAWTGHNPIPGYLQLCLESVRRHNQAQFNIVVITPENISDHLQDLHPAYPYLSYAHRADYLRAVLLHRYGGIYLDMDTICFRGLVPWYELICEYDIVNYDGGEFDELVGSGVFGPTRRESNFTTAWTAQLTEVLDRRYDNLVAHRQQDPDPMSDCLAWTEILAKIVVPLAKELDRQQQLSFYPIPPAHFSTTDFRRRQHDLFASNPMSVPDALALLVLNNALYAEDFKRLSKQEVLMQDLGIVSLIRHALGMTTANKPMTSASRRK